MYVDLNTTLIISNTYIDYVINIYKIINDLCRNVRCFIKTLGYFSPYVTLILATMFRRIYISDATRYKYNITTIKSIAIIRRNAELNRPLEML